RTPYFCGAGDDALALHSDQQAGPDLAAPGADFALSCMHIPVRWQFLQLAQVLPYPDRVRQRFTATHVSTWLMASGHVLRTQKELFPEITVGGGTYGLISHQTTAVICTAIILAPANITIRASSCDAAEKPYCLSRIAASLTHFLRSGFSR